MVLAGKRSFTISGGIADDHGIRGNILGYDGVGADNSAVAYRHTLGNESPMADIAIIADDGGL